jgi:hypothetical protein
MPHYAKRKRELDEEPKRINIERLKKSFKSESDWDDPDVDWKDSKGFKKKKDLIAWNSY